MVDSAVDAMRKVRDDDGPARTQTRCESESRGGAPPLRGFVRGFAFTVHRTYARA